MKIEIEIATEIANNFQLKIEIEIATEIANNFQLKIEIATEIERSHPSRLHNPIHFSDY